MVTEVPDTIPPGGVNVNNQAILLPPQRTATISKDQAISIAKTYDNAPGLSVTGVRLTDYTDPGSIPLKGVTVPFHTIQHVPAWVVTLTSPHPVDGSQAPHPVPLYVTHDNLVINAMDGSFVEGFFTK